MPLVASRTVRPNELQVACRPYVPTMRGNIRIPVRCSFQMPVNRTQCRPPFKNAEQCVRAVACEPVLRPQPLPVNRTPCRPPFENAEQCVRAVACQPVLRPQPLPPQCRPFNDALLSESPVRFLCSPCVIPPFEPTFQSYAVGTAACAFSQMEYQPVVSNIRQPLLTPQYPASQVVSNIRQPLLPTQYPESQVVSNIRQPLLPTPYPASEVVSNIRRPLLPPQYPNSQVVSNIRQPLLPTQYPASEVVSNIRRPLLPTQYPDSQVVSNIRQPFLPVQYLEPHRQLLSLPPPSQLIAPVASAELPCESVYTQEGALSQAIESSDVAKSVDEQNQSVFPTVSRSLGITPQEGSEKRNSSSSSKYACQNDECASQSQRRPRKLSETRVHNTQRSRDSRSDRDHRDRHKDTAKQRRSRLENQ